MASKGKRLALARLKKAGKAAVYENKNWKFAVTVVLCDEDEMTAVIDENIVQGKDQEPLVARGLSGLSMDSASTSASRGSRHYMMWVNTSSGMKCLGALAHEAVHIAGMALSDCNVPCDLRNIGESECVAYLVEDLVCFAVEKLENLGMLKGGVK